MVHSRSLVGRRLEGRRKGLCPSSVPLLRQLRGEKGETILACLVHAAFHSSPKEKASSAMHRDRSSKKRSACASPEAELAYVGCCLPSLQVARPEAMLDSVCHDDDGCCMMVIMAQDACSGMAGEEFAAHHAKEQQSSTEGADELNEHVVSMTGCIKTGQSWRCDTVPSR